MFRQHRGAATALATAGILVAFHLASSGDCLRSFFFLDDFWVMNAASRVDIRWPWDLWQLFIPSHLGFFLYRPLSTVGYFYLLRETVGYDPVGYHAVHLGFHVANGLLVYAVARALALPRAAAAATSIVYASAPGHALASCWIALFTVTGTAFLYFLTLWVWLQRSWRWRWPATACLCVAAVLASEHAVTLPFALLLVDVLLEPPVGWRVLARRHAPLVLPVVAYVALKGYLFSFLLPGAARRAGMDGSLQTAYGLTLEPAVIVRQLGSFFAWTVNLAYRVNEQTLLGTIPPGRQAWAFGLGLAVLVLSAGVTAWVLLRRQVRAELRLVAFGLDFFVLALAPVVFLRAHLFSFYVGIPALGMALALVAASRMIPRAGTVAPLVLAASLLVAHGLWARAAVRRERLALEFTAQTATATRWLHTLDRATADVPVEEVVVPFEGITVNLFDRGDAHRLLLCARYPVRLSSDLDAEPPAPGRLILAEPESLPDAARDSWGWLRRGCRAPAPAANAP